MKKLLFLAVAVAMGVMNAQAVATAMVADVDAFFDTSKVTDCDNYKTVYFLLKSDFTKWEEISGDYGTMKERAIASAGLEKREDGNLYVNDAPLGAFDKASPPELVALLTNEKAYALVDFIDFVQNKRFIFISSEDSTITSTTPFAGAEPVPEPTSGLLLLLGVAGLALRRKCA